MENLQNQQGLISSEPETTGNVLEDKTNYIVAAGGGIAASGKGMSTGDVISPVQEVPAQQIPEQKDLFTILKESQAEQQTTEPIIAPVTQNVPNENALSQPTQNVAPTQNITEDWSAKEQAYLKRVSDLEAQLTFQKELETNPLKTLAEYVPGVILNKESPYYFDPQQFVSQNITKKYGEDFLYNANDAYKVGTLSYEYRNDVEKWEREAQTTQTMAQQKQFEIEQQEAQVFEVSKSAVKAKYGMDDATFQSKILDKLKEMTDSDRLMLLSDAIMVTENHQRVTNNINTNTNSIRTMPPSPLDLKQNNSSAPLTSTEEQEFNKLFGSPRRMYSTY